MKLNAAQTEAINTIEGPVMVIAGPGTGKTEILALRIAKILTDTDTPPDGILALTFTESGAKAMRERLLQKIGEAAYYVNISTFHAFCSSVIQEFPDRFAVSLNLEPLSGLERVKLFRQILEANPFSHIKPPNEPFYYTSALTIAIQNLKREAVSPQKLLKLIQADKHSLDQQTEKMSKTAKTNLQKNIDKNLELHQVYVAYQKMLAESGRYDFEDMINFVADGLKKDPQLLRTYQERLLYFLVDEFQDTNASQSQVVNLLASFWGDKANVFVVGDPDQSIYRFQGASTENILAFKDLYPSAKIVTLDQNYRSTQTVLDASHALIGHNQLHFGPKDQKALQSQAQFKELKLSLARFPSNALEDFWIVQKVKSLIDQGVSPNQIAVLYRHNADSISLSETFAKFSLATDIEGGGDILEDPVINKFLTLLTFINNLHSHHADELDLFTLLQYEFLNIPHLDVLILSRAATKLKTTIFDLIHTGQIKQLKLTSTDQIMAFADKLSYWKQKDAQVTFSRLFEIILKESKFLDWVLTLPTSLEILNRLNSLFAEIKKLNSSDHQLNLAGFIQAIQMMRDNHLNIDEQDLDIKSNSITLSTAHKAKGREWDYVFIYRCVDKKWGNPQKRELLKLPQAILTHTDLDQKEKNEDERRLFYVCLTRARKKAYLTFADKYTSEANSKETVPSMFVTEIPDQFFKRISPQLNTQVKAILTQTLMPPPPPQASLAEKQFLTSVLQSFKLSPTALNTYLACPYKFKLNNLVKVPRAKRGYFAFGSAAHKAMEEFFRKFQKDDKYPSKDFLLERFVRAIKTEVLTKSELKDYLQKGDLVLSAYYDYYHDNFAKPMFIEKYFGGSGTASYLDDIPLSGKIDKVELIDETEKTVRVIDYKTGSTKSQNQVLGKTKDSHGDLFRQLVFYKLLFDLDRKFGLKVVDATLDFVESGAKTGKFVTRSFRITEEDTDKLKSEIRAAVKDIRELKFPRTTDYSHCVRCEFKNHCWPGGIPQSN